MAKISVNLWIDSDLLTNLTIYATQAECSVPELIERFCQQGLGIASSGSISDPDARLDRGKDNLLARVGAIETDAKSILQRLSVLESKVDVDIDVDDYLENWQKSLEPKIASLVDTFVEKRVEDILRRSRHVALVGNSEDVAIDYQIDSDYDDEPDEILTDFLGP